MIHNSTMTLIISMCHHIMCLPVYFCYPQNPVEVEPWEGVLQALETGNSCMQINSGDALAWVDEDCLNLHILTPAVMRGSSLDVRI